MGRKVIAFWLCLAMMLSFIVIIIEIAQYVEAPTTWYVDDVPGSSGPGDPPENFTSIQDAINASIDGDTVFVYNGTYYENVIVNRTINLTGENRDNTTIYGDATNDVVRIVIDWVNISGFAVTNCGSNAGDSGIELDNVFNCTVINNNVSWNNRIGIYLVSSSHNYILNNTVLSNTRRGIRLDSSYNNNVSGNNASFSDWEGILLLTSGQNNITGNNASDNGEGIYIYSSSGNMVCGNIMFNNSNGVRMELSSQNNTLSGNNITNNTNGIYIVNTQHKNIVMLNDIKNNEDGIRFSSSSNITVTNNRIFSNIDRGITTSSSTHNNIINNDVFDNEFGIFIDALSQNNDVTANNVSNHTTGGIYLFAASYNNITSNNVANNGVGIRITISSNTNKIECNNVSPNHVYGIQISSSSHDNLLIGNNVSLNNDGIWIASSNYNNIVTENNVSSNDDGIFLGSDDTNVTNNFVWNNNRGIYLGSSTSDNWIFHNNIIENTIQAVDLTDNGNHWNISYPSGGNFWSDFDESVEGAYDHYQGPDQDIYGSDRIVDNGTIAGGGKNPYMIDADSMDEYPLIHPFGNYMLLYPGWNLISLPLIQENMNVGSVLRSIKDSYDAVQWYNISDNLDHWKHNSTSRPSFLNDLDDLNHTMGFWVHITEPDVILFEYFGTPRQENQTIHLQPGWNLVGYPSFKSRNRTEALNNLTLGAHIDSIWTYYAAIQKYKELSPLDYFEYGQGYYIHVKEECIWEVPL